MGRDFSNGAQLRSNEIARDDDENWKVGLDSGIAPARAALRGAIEGEDIGV